MRDKNLLLVGVLIFHFTITFLYLVPYKPPVQVMNQFVNYYMVPQFHQNWVVFAPDPPQYSVDFVYKLHYEDGSYSNWDSPRIFYMSESYANRFSHFNKLWINHRTIARRLLWLHEENQESTEFFNEQVLNYLRWLVEFQNQDGVNVEWVELSGLELKGEEGDVLADSVVTITNPIRIDW